MSTRLIVKCPHCSTRLRLGGSKPLPPRFKVRCTTCRRPFVGRVPDGSGTSRDSVTEGNEPGQSTERLLSRADTHVAEMTFSPPTPGSSSAGGATDTLEGATTALPSRGTDQGSGSGTRDPTTTFTAGEVIAERYRIERFVAKGGMGEVYEARDTALDQEVALKVVRPDVVSNPGALERFKREIHVARRVTHRNVCRIHDLGTHRSTGPLAVLYPGGEIPFVTMELLGGESLAERLKRVGPLSLDQALPMIEQMAAALDEAHGEGIVHRDFKPANVMLAPAEGGERVVVTDFGLARAVAEAGHTVTVAGTSMGSPVYMAPEQVQGDEVGPAADVYALGVVLYEMATGRVPFKGETPITTAVKRLSEPPPPPSAHREDVDPSWEKVILRCLEREPSLRFAAAGAVMDALRGEEAPRAESTIASRRKVAMAMLAGFLVALAVAVNVVVWQGRADRKRNPYLELEASNRPSAAVVSLENMTGREDVAWLSVGLAQMLGTELSEGGAIRVLPREDVARARRELGMEGPDPLRNEDLAGLQGNLGAGYVIGGSYTVAGGGDDPRIRLDLKLRGRDAGAAPSIVVEGTESEIFDLVDRAGEELRGALEVEVREAEATLRWVSQEAARKYAEGIELAEQQQYERARRRLEEAVAEDPRNPRARVALASVLQYLGYRSRAREEMRLAVELADVLPPAERLEVRARDLELRGEHEEAASLYDQLWRRFPDDLEQGLALARTLVAAGRPSEAAQVVEALKRLAPGAPDPRILFMEASAAAARGDVRRQQEAAARAGELAATQEATLQLAEARLLEGWAWRNLGDPARAQALTEEARALYASRGDRAGEARASVQGAALLHDQGNLDAARQALEDSLERYGELGDRSQEAQILNNLAVVLRQQGDPDRALELYERTLALARETGSRAGQAQAQNNLGVLRLKRGDLSEARSRFDEAISIARQIGDRSHEAYALHNSALVLRRMGLLEEAETRQRRALALRRKSGQRLGEAASLADLGTIALHKGHLEEALKRYEESLQIARKTENRRLEAFALYGLAESRFEQGRMDVAETLHEQALAIREELGEGGTVAESRLALARLDLERGRSTAALEKLSSAIPALEAESSRDEVAIARALEAGALAAEERDEDARRSLGLALGWLESSEDLAASLRIDIHASRVELRLGQPRDALTRARATAALAREAGLVPIFLEAQLLVSELVPSEEEARDVRAEVRTEALAIGFERLARGIGPDGG